MYAKEFYYPLKSFFLTKKLHLKMYAKEFYYPLKSFFLQKNIKSVEE